MQVAIQIQVQTINMQLEAINEEASERAWILNRIGDRIIERAERLTVTEERQLRSSINISDSLFTEILNELGEGGGIRRIKYAGKSFIVAVGATKEQVIEALKRNVRSKQSSDMTTTPRGRRNRYGALKGRFDAEPSRQASRGALKPLVETHYSETKHFGDSYAEALIAEPLDAEILSGEATASEEREYMQIPNRPIGEREARLVEIQKRTNQGFRNTKNARTRWIQTEAGQNFVAGNAQKRLLEEAAQRERRDAARVPINERTSGVMSPEQAYEEEEIA